MECAWCLPPSADAAADPLERKAADVVPVEPDEECLAADVIVGHEAPVAAIVTVVAVVAHHQVVPRRDFAAEPAIIVNAVLLAWKRPYVQRIHWLRRRVHRNRVFAVTRTLGQPFG